MLVQKINNEFVSVSQRIPNERPEIILTIIDIFKNFTLVIKSPLHFIGSVKSLDFELLFSYFYTLHFNKKRVFDPVL